jgi:hypothetical protein
MESSWIISHLVYIYIKYRVYIYENDKETRRLNYI